MRAPEQGRRLAAIMFTDMVGYSALTQKNERLALQLVDEHRRMVRALLPRFAGREVDTTGDGFLIEFQSASQAVSYGIALQQRQAAYNRSAAEDRRFQFRVGIHLGEVEPRGHNIIGDGVNIAARIEPLAPPDGLAFSGAVHALVRNKVGAEFRSIGTPALKNITESVEVFVLDAHGLQAVAVPQLQDADADSRSKRAWLIPAAALMMLALPLSGLLLVPEPRVQRLSVWLAGKTAAPQPAEPAKTEEGPQPAPAPAQREVVPGAVIRDCADCPELVRILGGSFGMGSNGGEADEKPMHRVTIPPFALGKYEVTFAQWDACVAAGGCSHRPDDAKWGRGTRPVMRVSWNDAQEYLRWLSKRTSRHYRLPTEAEWEYAARAGTATEYYWGDSIGANNANCTGCGSPWDKKQTAPVGSFPPNAFGLYDMLGNVMEWVQDCYHDSYVGAPEDGSAWTAGSCQHRVQRGGSWDDEAVELRSADRDGSEPGDRDNDGGFRVSRTD